jgi:hypothetical protein
MTAWVLLALEHVTNDCFIMDIPRKLLTIMVGHSGVKNQELASVWIDLSLFFLG